MRYRTFGRSVRKMVPRGRVPARRLEDRIGELCEKARAAQSDGELDPIIADLQSALREHNERLRKRFALTLGGGGDGGDGLSHDRRAS